VYSCQLKVQNTRINSNDDFQIWWCSASLFPTDVASRGLDVNLGFAPVINFDVPDLWDLCASNWAYRKSIKTEGESHHLCQSCWRPSLFQRIEEWFRNMDCGWAWKIQLKWNCQRRPLPNASLRSRLDHLMQRDNPDYKGAFTTKKEQKKPNKFKEREKKERTRQKDW